MKNCVNVGIGLIERSLGLSDENELRMQLRGYIGANLAGKICVDLVVGSVVFSFSNRTFLAFELGTSTFDGVWF
jgi:hypothetical protein